MGLAASPEQLSKSSLKSVCKHWLLTSALSPGCQHHALSDATGSLIPLLQGLRDWWASCLPPGVEFDGLQWFLAMPTDL